MATSDIVSGLLLVAALAGFAHACRMLANDAREGTYVTMGGQMLFSHIWFLSAALGAVAMARLAGIAWWQGVGLFVALVVLMWPVRWMIVTMYLGRDAPPPPKDGLREFLRKTAHHDDSR